MTGSNGKQKPQRPVVRGRSIDSTMREAQRMRGGQKRDEIMGRKKETCQTQDIRKTDQRLEERKRERRRERERKRKAVNVGKREEGRTGAKKLV